MSGWASGGSGWREARWTNGKKTITGRYLWAWSAKNFLVELDSRDSVTGMQRSMNLGDIEVPEWGKWKLVRDEEEAAAA